MPNTTLNGQSVQVGKDLQSTKDAAILQAKVRALQTIYGNTFTDVQAGLLLVNEFTEPELTITQSPDGTWTVGVSLSVEDVEVPADWAPGAIIDYKTGKLANLSDVKVSDVTLSEIKDSQAVTPEKAVTTLVADGFSIESYRQQIASEQEAQRLKVEADRTLAGMEDAKRSAVLSIYLKNNYFTDEHVPNIVKVEEKDGKVIVYEGNGASRELRQDDLDLYGTLRNSNLALFEQQDNELKAFKNWAAENSRLTTGQIDTLTTYDSILRTDQYADFQSYVDSYKNANNGLLPYSKPYDQLVAMQAAKANAEAEAAARKVRDGGAADAVDSSAQADASTVQNLSAEERIRINNNGKSLDDLKREAIGGGTEYQAKQAAAAAEIASRLAAREAESSDESFTPVDAIKSSASDPSVVTDAQAGEGFTSYVVDNPLDQFSNYTYGIALHVLTEEEHKQLSQNAADWKPSHTLIASAGRWDENVFSTSPLDQTVDGDPTLSKTFLRREPGWEHNFFFDGLKVSQVVGPSSTNRTTNTIDIEFTIIEPYGLSLLDRLLKTSKKLKQPTYMQLCYMLQIDFYDSQFGLLIEHRKYIPISIFDMKVKVSGKGSEYVCTAAPFHHRSLLQSMSTTPANFDVSSMTLREFFADTNASDTNLINNSIDNQRNEIANLAKQQNIGEADAAARILEQNGSLKDKTYEINSYIAGVNSWYAKLKQLNVVDQNSIPNSIKVRFHDEIIAGEKMARPSEVDSSAGRSAMAKPDMPRDRPVADEKKRDRWSIPAGMAIPEVINMVMLSSDYIRGQVLVANKNEATTTSKKGIVKWWKILPSISITGFDAVINRWTYDVTYFVLPYLVYNTKHPNLPKQSPKKADVVKYYKYLYSGENTSIIDFQIDFDMLYITTISALKEVNTDDDTRDAQGNDATAEQSGKDSNDRSKKTSNTITPVSLLVVSQDLSAITGKKVDKDPVSVAISSMNDSIYSRSTGDMLTLTLKIIGDPTLIKQDDIFFNVNKWYDPNGRTATSDGIKVDQAYRSNGDITLNNNALIMDAGEVLAWIDVVLPTDMDDLKGGTASVSTDTTTFSGVYRVQEVVNEFKTGKFEQTLTLIRYQEQDIDFEVKDEERAALTDEQLAEEERILGILNNTGGTDSSGAVTTSGSTSSGQAVSADESAGPKPASEAPEIVPLLNLDRLPQSEGRIDDFA
jgi:hypothetical protein